VWWYRGVAGGAGHAHLFNGRTGALVRSYQPPAGNDPGSGFGFGVGGGIEPGDVNRDGVPDLLIASPGQGNGDAHNAGRLYVINAADGAILRTLNDPNPRPGGSLGFLRTSAGDINADGTPDILAGRPTFSPAGYLPDPPPGGAAYVFDGATGAASPLERDDVDRLLLCTGKVYYDLLAARDAAGDRRTPLPPTITSPAISPPRPG